MRRDQSSPGHLHENESLPLCPLLGGGAAKGGKPRGLGGRVALERRGKSLRARGPGRDIPMGPVKGEPKRTVELRPPKHPDTRLNASQDGIGGTGNEKAQKRTKRGECPSRRGSHGVPSPAVFRKGHRRGVPSFGRGHLLRSHTHSWPSGDTGRVAIELRPILQPTSLRARWTPRRDDFRVVRDDRRLVTMGAV